MNIRYSYMESFYSKNAKRMVPSPHITKMEANDWLDFVNGLEGFSYLQWKSKDTAPLISPAFYDKEKYRKNENVSGWSFLALDVDGGVLIPDMILLLQDFNYKFALYTTASCTTSKHKFRVFIPFNRIVKPSEMNDVWAGAFELFGRTTDSQCKDKSRGYYVPGIYPNALTIFKKSIDGSCVEVDDLLALSPPKLKVIIQKPKANLYNLNISWSGLDDCPFVKKEWIAEYLAINGAGHYIGLYNFMLKVASSAHFYKYDITASQVGDLAEQLDVREGNRWKNQNRLFSKEAQNAIDYSRNS